MKPIKQWRQDLGLSEAQMARYLGVPVPTLRKWAKGTRTPDSAPQRLFDILTRIEREAPDLHDDLVEEARTGLPESPVAGFLPPVDTDGASGPDNGPSAIPAWLSGALG